MSLINKLIFLFLYLFVFSSANAEGYVKAGDNLIWDSENKSYTANGDVEFKNEAACVLTIVLASGDVLVYRRHPQPRLMYDDDDIGYLPLAFVRVKHSVVTRPPRYHGKKKHLRIYLWKWH